MSAIRETLREAYCHAPYPYVRERAHAVLLSSRGFSMAQIAKIYEIQYQAVSRWLDSWEDHGICSGLIAPNTEMRDNTINHFRCHNERKENTKKLPKGI